MPFVVEVDRHLSLVREVGEQVDANLKRADRLRQSILTKAFSGELTKPTSYSEPEHPVFPMASEDSGDYHASIPKATGQP